jgi:hypothetical protein
MRVGVVLLTVVDSGSRIHFELFSKEAIVTVPLGS